MWKELVTLILGDLIDGPAGMAVSVELEPELRTRPDWEATVATYFINAPGQSILWRHYILAIIHLRDIDGVPPAHIAVPGSTHEVMLYALDPQYNPRADDHETWHRLVPINLVMQVELPDDDAAKVLLALAAQAVVDGILWAEPPLSGQVEPWQSSLIKSAAHLRGEEHAP